MKFFPPSPQSGVRVRLIVCEVLLWVKKRQTHVSEQYHRTMKALLLEKKKCIYLRPHLQELGGGHALGVPGPDYQGLAAELLGCPARLLDLPGWGWWEVQPVGSGSRAGPTTHHGHLMTVRSQSAKILAYKIHLRTMVYVHTTWKEVSDVFNFIYLKYNSPQKGEISIHP